MSDRFYQNARPIHEGLTPQKNIRYVESAWLAEDEPEMELPVTPEVRAAATVEIARRKGKK